MKKVIVYRSELLPYSETFIREQVISYSRWSTVLVGLRQIPGTSLEGIDVRLLSNKKNNIWRRACRKFLSKIGMEHRGYAEKILAENANIIHVHFGTDAVAAWPIFNKIDLPIVITLHGYDVNVDPEWWEAGNGPRSARKYPQRLREISKKKNVYFVAVSEAIRQSAIAFGIPEEKISVQYIGVDLRKFFKSKERTDIRKKRIIYVGRMVEKKGGSVLIEAFSKVVKLVPQAELVMIGDGPLLPSYKKLAKTYGVPVRFLGACTPAEVKKNMDTARAFCLPSLTAKNGDAEGLGIALLEAQACGIPVITSARGGATEGIVDGRTGFAFKEGDVEQLTNRLLLLLSNDDLASAMSHEGPKFVAAKFDIQKCTKTLEDFYERIECDWNSQRA